MPYGLKDIELAKLNEVFAANERIERVILYGSRAKGNYKPFSDVDITLEDFEAALGDYGITITNKEGHYAANSNYGWGGNLTSIEVGAMFKFQTNEACTITVEGALVDPAEHPITLVPGVNWIGFIGTESMSLSDAFVNLTPTNMDYIQTKDGVATYYQGIGWRGSISSLNPGEGFIYTSNATSDKTFTYPTSSTNK